MKFDFVIGNPPYQEETEGTSDNPIYNLFMDEAFKLSSRVELITPARFLFRAGKTPKEWNNKMLSDEHFKVINYTADSDLVFPNTDIKGGVAITYRDETKNFGAIGTFSAYDELMTIQRKVVTHLSQGNLSDIMILQNRFDLDVLFEDFPEYKTYINSKGELQERTEKRIVTSSFTMDKVFIDEKVSNEDVQVLGLINNNRTYKWIKRKYILDNGNLNCYKVLIPKTNGTGTLGEALSTPLIGMPQIGYTQSFIGIGSFINEEEAISAKKYISSKFARTMLGILKITQDNPPEKWIYVPLQDFTSESDIDWSQSISDIDAQLYRKYGLDDKEIEFIESHVKEME